MTQASAGRALWVPFVALAGGIVVVDQLTKAWLASFLQPGQSVSVVGDLVRLVHAQNSGGLFGLLRGQALAFGLVSLVVVALIVAYHGKAGRNPYLTLTLGLLLGGAVGNLIDRLRIGYVVDFVDAGIGSWRWYTFNVADSAISLAIVLLVAMSLFPGLARGGGRDGQATQGPASTAEHEADPFAEDDARAKAARDAARSGETGPDRVADHG